MYLYKPAACANDLLKPIPARFETAEAPMPAKLAINGGTPVRTKPFPSWPVYDERELAALEEVLRSGHWGCTSGGKVKAFQQEFADFCRAKHAICLTNGTAALEVALRAVGVEPGDEVIVPPYTFIATASSVVMVGGIPVFVDIEPGTFNMDPTKIEAAITDRTKAVVPVHIGGRPADMDAICDIAKRRGLKVIEDCCQAHGAEWRGQRVGTLGDAGAFSFQSSKNINSGEGGAVVTNDDEIAGRAYSLVNVGRVPGGGWYQHEFMGSNYRMTEFQGAILQVQFSRWPEQAKRRDENGAILCERLAQIDGVSPMDHDDRITRNAYHLYIFRYHEDAFAGMPRSRFLQAVSAEGVGISGGYTPLQSTGLFKQLSSKLDRNDFMGGRRIDYGSLSLPVTDRVCEHEGVWISQSRLIGPSEDAEDIAAAVAKVSEHRDELLEGSDS